MSWFLETPLMQELLNDRSRDDFQVAILDILRDKFTEVPEDVTVRLRAIQDAQQLRQLLPHAARCDDLAAFLARLPS